TWCRSITFKAPSSVSVGKTVAMKDDNTSLKPRPCPISTTSPRWTYIPCNCPAGPPKSACDTPATAGRRA
ncbi:hypothetical protein D7Y27_28840, partial [Corallococcus sp. AB004]